MMKICTKCKKELPSTIEYFYRHVKSKDGLNWRCKSCVLDEVYWCKLKSLYGITKEEYEKILKEQNYHCAICGNGERVKKKQKLSVDHNHKTGNIRGLLCDDCNNMIGRAKESPLILDNAIKYLRKYK